MKCFSELLKMYIVQEEFDYHPKCREIDLVNLSFADDLFILYGATEVSLKLIRKTLRMFGDLLGLHLNSSKSSCYFAGVSQTDEQKLCSILGITASTLPMKYIVIPLTTKQLEYEMVSETRQEKFGGGRLCGIGEMYQSLASQLECSAWESSQLKIGCSLGIWLRMIHAVIVKRGSRISIFSFSASIQLVCEKASNVP
ncbi:hypothetical protein LIER_30439 [Lithospermum erythrorhizon]|uniref:Reverse transcriptase domain-containing protein n=1 Tax=Lithospermum erythrorhizon TaxID=34254 RepID=A0AAV3RML5_LITER